MKTFEGYGGGGEFSRSTLRSEYISMCTSARDVVLVGHGFSNQNFKQFRNRPGQTGIKGLCLFEQVLSNCQCNYK